MCVTSGVDGGKAATIFDIMDEKFTKDGIPWLNAISLSVDNTNAMIGRNNSIASRCKAKNQSIFISGCPCHLAHLAATAANDSFTEAIGVNVEDVLIDLYYWFDKSSKRKEKLAEYFEFCDQEYQQVLKHVTCCWLSLECCIERTLTKFQSLKSYFLSEGFSDARFIKRLRDAFSNPLREPVLLLHSASIQLFTHFNKLLQRSEPTIHVLQTSMLSLAKNISNRTVKPQVLVHAKITDVNLNEEEIFIEHKNIYLGETTKHTLNKLLNEGDISDAQYYNKFFLAAPAISKVHLHIFWENFH